MSTGWQLDALTVLINVVLAESRADAEQVYKMYSPAIWPLSDDVPSGFSE